MSKIDHINTALAALGDAQKHEEAAGAVTVGTPSDPSGQDDEERLAQDQRDARRRAASGRAADAIRAMRTAYPDAFSVVQAEPVPAIMPDPVTAAATQPAGG